MWPKAFAQFIELAPHISRLLPMADRFFQSKASSDDAARRSAEAMEAATKDLRGDLAQVTTAHVTFGKQLEEIRTKLDGSLDQLSAATRAVEGASADARGARAAAETLELRVTKLEAGQHRLILLSTVAMVLLVLLLALLVFALVHVR